MGSCSVLGGANSGDLGVPGGPGGLRADSRGHLDVRERDRAIAQQIGHLHAADLSSILDGPHMVPLNPPRSAESVVSSDHHLWWPENQKKKKKMENEERERLDWGRLGAFQPREA